MGTATRYSSSDKISVVYTISSSPSVGDTIYDEQKQDSGKKVSSVSSGTISWNNTLSWKHECNVQEAITEGDLFLSINSTTYNSAEYPSGSITLNTGDTVSLYFFNYGGSGMITKDSSNESYIPNGVSYSSSSPLTFTMPNDSISFTIYTEWSGPT